MDIPVVSIGKSKAILLSKPLLEKYSIKDTVEVILKKNYFIVKPNHIPRKGWGRLFKQMHENGDDELLIPDVF